MVSTAVLLALCIGICSANIVDSGFRKYVNGVRRFDIPNEGKLDLGQAFSSQNLLGKLRSSLLLGGRPMGLQPGHSILPLLMGLGGRQSGKTVTDFKISNCSATKPPSFVIQSLDLKPDPVKLPGDLKLSFRILNKMELNNLMVNLTLKMKTGEGWFPIPCIGGIGSCPYDVCQQLRQVSACPPDVVASGFDCQCPFKKTTYQSDDITATVGGTVFLAGTYQVEALMTNNGDFVGCYDAQITISG